MNYQFQKATRTKSKARIALSGPSGAGKTYTALECAKALTNGNGIAVIDTERGSASLYSDKFEFNVLELDYFSPDNYIKAIHAAEDAGFDVIVIDSLSHAWEGEGGALDIHNAKTKQSGNSWTAWADVTPIHRKLIDSILQSKCHIITTMRSKMEYVQEKDSNGKTVIRKVGLSPVQRTGIEYEFTLIAEMDTEHNINVSKSRISVMDQKTGHKPDERWFRPMVEWLAEGKAAHPKPKPAMKEAAEELGGVEAASGELAPMEIPEKMTLEFAEDVTGSNGERYGDLETKDLAHRYNALNKKVAKGVRSEDYEETLMKMDAISFILKHRANNG